MTEKKKKIPQVSISIPESLLEWVDKVVDMKIYGSRGEIMRMALKEFISKESSFIQTLKLDLEKLNDVHKKYIEFKDQVLEQISPNFSNPKFINE